MKRLMIPVLCIALILPAAAVGPAFRDVERAAWYAPAIDYCAQNGLMTGVDDHVFAPRAAMTRGAAVTVLHRLKGSPAAKQTEKFTDVPPWYTAAVDWAIANGITTDITPGIFAPRTAITREQLAVYFWRAAGSPKAAKRNSFPDGNKIAFWASDAVDWMAEQGLMGGRDDGRFCPKDRATRAECAQILMNYDQGTGIPRTTAALEEVYAPSGLALDKDGSLLMTDLSNKVVWKLSRTGGTQYAGGITVAGLYGEPVGGYNDAGLAVSYFAEPWAIAPFLDGWAVSDPANNAIRTIRPKGVETLNAKTTENLKKDKLGVVFQRPTGLAADGGGNLYVADTDAGAIRKIDAKGDLTTVADKLEEPTGLCWANGILYIAETGKSRVVKLENGKVTALDGQFHAPQGVAVGPDGAVYVSDTVGGAVRRVKGGKVDTILSRDPKDPESGPTSPRGLLVDGDTLYVCDVFGRKLMTVAIQ